MSEIQAKLFNTFLAWDNNEIVWFAETEPKVAPEPSTPVLDSLVNEGQLYFELNENNETS